MSQTGPVKHPTRLYTYAQRLVMAAPDVATLDTAAALCALAFNLAPDEGAVEEWHRHRAARLRAGVTGRDETNRPVSAEEFGRVVLDLSGRYTLQFVALWNLAEGQVSAHSPASEWRKVLIEEAGRLVESDDRLVSLVGRAMLVVYTLNLRSRGQQDFAPGEVGLHVAAFSRDRGVTDGVNLAADIIQSVAV